MIDRVRIVSLIPHQGAMCLLDRAATWSDTRIACNATSHLEAHNPLRRGGRLSAVCGCEYGFQAAALHGALLAGGVAQAAGYLARLQVTSIGCRYLDDPELGLLGIEATLEFAEPAGLIYGFSLTSERGAILLEGRFTVRIPPAAAT